MDESRRPTPTQPMSIVPAESAPPATPDGPPQETEARSAPRSPVAATAAMPAAAPETVAAMPASAPETAGGAGPAISQGASTNVSPRRWRKGLIVAVGVPAFLLGAVLAAHRPLLGMILRHKAAALGVDLDWDDFDPGLGSVRLTRARASLSGVRGVKVTAASVTLGRSGLSVGSVEADGVAATIEGPASERVLEVAAWSSDHPDTYRLRGSATNVKLEWRARADAPAWLTMSGGSFTTDGSLARFTAATTTAFGVPMGAVGATYAVDASGLTIEAGKRQGADAPVVASLKPSAKPPTLSLALRPVEVSALGTALGLSLPARGAVASGRVDLTLGKPSGMSGTASLDLDGWVPPHPKYLDGVVFGKKTSVRSRVHVSEDRAAVKLDDLEVKAGRLDMKGSGSITEEGDHAKVRLEIAGPIPCADLARSVASQELGGLLGALAGSAVGGSAKVTVTVEGDARDLGAAKVTPKVGNGCELKLPF